MIKYPDRALPGLVRLYSRFNDVTIFVEDTTNRNMYQALFERMIGDRARLKKIFPLHGRQKVIEAASSKRFTRYAPCLFIIDADWDLLLRVEAPKIKDLYRLSCYCSENLLVCEKASIEIGFESASDDTRSAVQKAIGFAGWRKNVATMLFPLFVRYAVVHRFGLPIETASYHVLRLCDGKSPKRGLSKSKVAARLSEVESQILAHISRKQMKEAEKEIRTSAGKGVGDKLRYISGKTYLFPLLVLHLKQVTRLRDAEAALTVRFARHSDLAIDPGLAGQISRLVALA
jgi:hypothetical protein